MLLIIVVFIKKKLDQKTWLCQVQMEDNEYVLVLSFKLPLKLWKLWYKDIFYFLDLGLHNVPLAKQKSCL